MPTQLKDNFGRRFQYLRLSITDVCNFRCNYCLPDGYKRPQTNARELPLTRPEIQTLVSAFAAMGTKKIRITGGEPATRKDLPKIISTCKSTEGIEKVAVTTNGYNLGQNIESWHSAGLDAVNISLDSLDKTRFSEITGQNCFDKIMAGLDKATYIKKLQVKTNAVLLRQFNIEQFEQFKAFVKTRPVTARFIELMETGDNRIFFKENSLSSNILLQSLLEQGWKRVNKGPTAGPAVELEHSDFEGRIGLIMPYGPEFCSSCNRLRVSSTGKLHLCLFAEDGINLRPYLRNGDVVGIIRKVRKCLQDKKVAHLLHHGYTGSTQQLAMLGG